MNSVQMLSGAETALEKRVEEICNGYAENYESGVVGFLEDLSYGGCQSGVVGELIYYDDTVKFYQQHSWEIGTLLAELCQDTGEKVGDLLRGWDEEDPLALSTPNQNLLAWFAFEEVARRIAIRNGIEL